MTYAYSIPRMPRGVFGFLTVPPPLVAPTPITPTPPPLAAALALVKDGFAVFPVNKDKKPCIKGWQTEGATTDPAQVAKWWGTGGRFASENIAISCGPSDLVVVDVDPRNGGSETFTDLQRVQGIDLWQGVVVETGGGGWHFYLSAGGKRFRSGNGVLAPGVDVKAVGGFVVAPPSLHTSGGVYRWRTGHSLADLSLLPVPDSLALRLKAAPVKSSPTITRTKKATKTSASRNNLYLHSSPLPLAPTVLASLASLLVPPMTSNTLIALDQNEQFVRAAAQYLGMPMGTPLGEPFCCILPGHAEQNPSAAFQRNQRGFWYYHDYHAGKHGGPEKLSVAEVFAAQCSRRVGKQPKPSHAVWKLRLLVEMGLVTPALVCLPPLPESATPATARVYAGIALLLGCRWLYDPLSPTPLSWRFVEAWCDVGQETAAKAIQFLHAHHIIEEVDTHVGQFGKPMKVYLPYGMVIPATIRASLAAYARALEDTSDLKRYKRLRECVHAFAPYVPALLTTRGFAPCREAIRARLTEEAAARAAIARAAAKVPKGNATVGPVPQMTVSNA